MKRFFWNPNSFLLLVAAGSIAYAFAESVRVASLAVGVAALALLALSAITMEDD